MSSISSVEFIVEKTCCSTNSSEFCWANSSRSASSRARRRRSWAASSRSTFNSSVATSTVETGAGTSTFKKRLTLAGSS